MTLSTLLGPVWTWVRRNLGWSNSRQSWAERLATAALLAGAGAAAWFGPSLSPAAHAAVWIALVIAFAIVLRRGWVKLFGPVFFYDLVRTARRRNFLLVRFLYIAALTALFFFAAEMIIYGEVNDLSGVAEVYTAELRPRQLVELTEAFSYIFLGLQLGIAFLLTPVTVAGAIAEQRQRRTLEYLLATDLRNREIILGTLASRLTNLLVILMGGLPLLALMQFLGGVDPQLMLAGFAATALTVLSLGCLSILNSVATRRPLQAIMRTYLEAAAYLGLTAGFKYLLWSASRPWALMASLGMAGLANFPSTPDWTSPVTVQDLADWLNAGNIGSAIFELGEALSKGTPLDTVLPGLLEGYAWFHGLFALVCLTWAVARLRPIALKFAEGPIKRRAALIARRRPPIGRWPMMWKELFSDGPIRRRRLARWGIGFLVVASLLPALGALAFFTFLYPFASWDQLGEFLNDWLRVTSTSVACLLFLSIALRAAASVAGERDRQTLDMLLTTPLSSRAILGGKWFGSLLAPRPGGWWLAAIWGLAYFGGGLDLRLLPLLLGACLVYAAFFASLGLWFSVRCRTTTQAVMGVIFGIAVVTVGHFIIAFGYLTIANWLFYGSVEAQAQLQALSNWAEAIHVYGLTPPATLDLISSVDFEQRWNHAVDEWSRNTVAAVLGLGLYAAGSVVLWWWAGAYFRKSANRAPVRLPIPETAKDSTSSIGEREALAPCLSEETGS